jgi:hypothetical protein
MTHSGLAFLAGLCIAMGGDAADQSKIVAEPPTDKTRTLESRLRDLEYPELRKRTAAEIEVYKQLAAHFDQFYKRVEAVYRQGYQGGSTATLAQAGLNAELAQAELAWSERRVEDAYAHTYRATRHGKRWVDALTAMYDSGVAEGAVGYTIVERLEDAQIRWAKTRLQLIRAEKVAKETGVDLTEVKRREPKLYEKNQPTRANLPLPPLPPPSPLPSGRG